MQKRKECDRNKDYDQSFGQASNKEIQMAFADDTMCYNDKGEQEDQQVSVINEPIWKGMFLKVTSATKCSVLKLFKFLYF